MRSRAVAVAQAGVDHFLQHVHRKKAETHDAFCNRELRVDLFEALAHFWQHVQKTGGKENTTTEADQERKCLGSPRCHNEAPDEQRRDHSQQERPHQQKNRSRHLSRLDRHDRDSRARLFSPTTVVSHASSDLGRSLDDTKRREGYNKLAVSRFRCNALIPSAYYTYCALFRNHCDEV